MIISMCDGNHLQVWTIDYRLIILLSQRHLIHKHLQIYKQDKQDNELSLYCIHTPTTVLYMHVVDHGMRKAFWP